MFTYQIDISNSETVALIGGSISALIGAAVSAWVAFRVLNKNHRLENDKKARDDQEFLKGYGEVFMYSLHVILKNTSIQVDHLKDWVLKVDVNPYIASSPPFITYWKHFDRLNEESLVTIWKLLSFYDFSKKDFGKILGNLDHIESTTRAMYTDIFEETIPKVIRLSNQFLELKTHLISYATQFQKMQKLSNPNYSEIFIFHYIDSSVKVYYEKANETPDILFDMEELVRPWKLIFLKYGGYTDFSLKVLNDLKTLGDLGETIAQTNIHFSQDVSVATERLNASIDNLSLILQANSNYETLKS